jgi:hypothetical protein
MANDEWRVASGEYVAGSEWLIGGGCVVSETHPRPFPKGREAPSGEGSSVKSVGSEAYRLLNQKDSPFPLGRAGDGSSSPQDTAVRRYRCLQHKVPAWQSVGRSSVLWRRTAVRRYPGFCRITSHSSLVIRHSPLVTGHYLRSLPSARTTLPTCPRPEQLLRCGR